MKFRGRDSAARALCHHYVARELCARGEVVGGYQRLERPRESWLFALLNVHDLPTQRGLDRANAVNEFGQVIRPRGNLPVLSVGHVEVQSDVFFDNLGAEGDGRQDRLVTFGVV